MNKNSDLPADIVLEVTPSDTDGLALGKCRSLYVGVAGDLSIVVNGVTVTFPAIAGYHPMRATQVNSTGTTATDILALY